MFEPDWIVVWRLTEACDLDCGFCAYARSLSVVEGHRPRATADPQQVLAFGKILGDYAQAYSRQVLVSWLGGEPLRWPPLFDISRVFKHEFGLRLSATTNGTALASAKVREQVMELFDELTVSVDGLGPAHDQLRGAPGLFDQLRASLVAFHQLKLQRQRSLRLRVNTILMRHTLADFPHLCETLANWGVAELTFNALGGRDRPEFFPDHALLPDDIAWLRRELPALRQRMAKRGLTLLGSDSYLTRLSASAANYHLPITNCSPGQRFLFIDENNIASPCSYTTQGYGVPLSGLHSAADLHHLPQHFADRQREQLLAPCYDCPSTQVFGKFQMADFGLQIDSLNP